MPVFKGASTLCPGKLFIVLLCLVITLKAERLQGQVLINEMMASNASTLADEDGDYPDWIELYNSSSEPFPLQGFGMSDNPSNPFKWTFPQAILPPNGYLVVFASGKNRTSPFGPLHTNFSISAQGETLLLTSPDGIRMDLLPPVTLAADISFGRLPGTPDSLRYFETATPGGPNNTPAFLGYLVAPHISFTPLSDSTFHLEITLTDPQAAIYYTTNGAAPDINAPQYQNPLVLSFPQSESLMYIRTNPPETDTLGFGWKSPEAIFPKAIVVRAKAYREGFISSPVNTRTYTNRSWDFPLVSIATDAQHLFSDSTGIYVPGIIYQQNGYGPDMYGYPNANYFQEGPEWERPANVEFIFPGKPGLSQPAGMRIHGERTRALPMKSIRLYSRSEYGPSTFDADIFDNGKTNYKRLILRNSGQDFFIYTTMLRDAAIQRINEGLNFGRQACKPAIVFINGEFWGLHNIRERQDKYYLQMHYGINPDNIDLLEQYWAEVDEGDNLFYWETFDYLTANSPQLPEVYDSVSKRIDIESFIDYQIANIFANNTDWPGNNIRIWRSRNPFDPSAPYGHDGRLRWLMYDTDFGFGLFGGAEAATFNTLAFATNETDTSYANPPDATLFLRRLLENEVFRTRFINRYADLLNSWYKPHRTAGILAQMAGNIAPFMPLHIQRWGYPQDLAQWHDNLLLMHDFAAQRPAYAWQHLREKFDLGQDAEIVLDVNDPQMGWIRINTLPLLGDTPGLDDAPYPWSGMYFEGVPVALKAIPYDGYTFVGWEGLPELADSVVYVPVAGTQCIKALFAPEQSEPRQIIHYWHFNQLASGQLGQITSDYSAVGSASISYAGTGAGYMDRVSDGTTLNGQQGAVPGYALRVRNPSNNRLLVFTFSTTGYTDLRLSYAVRRTPNGQQSQQLFYRTSPDGSWNSLGAPRQIKEDYQLAEYVLDSLSELNNRPEVQLAIGFPGPEAAGNEGNNRFDNVLIEGRLITLAKPDKKMSAGVFPNPVHRSDGHINIRLEKNYPLNIRLLDLQGRIVLDQKFEATNNVRLKLPDGLSGIYLLRLESGQESSTLRLVVVN
ncbi:MAG: CotH kinase family protein [Bacteroidetes bacterium]|nr:CotH kinase family protein [Bacteroidota bacterium]